jgi:hypothetical protein
MQNYLLGIGHQTMQYFEYAIVEDFYRLMAKECGEPIPHKFQSAIWSTLAGAISYTDAFMKCITPVTFHLAPDPTVIQFVQQNEELMKAITNVAEHIHLDNIRQKAIELVRRKLLEVGYLNAIPKDHSDANTSTFYFITFLLTDQDSVTLNLIVPIREQNKEHIVGFLNMRKSYAKRQGRTLKSDELAEEQALNESLQALKSSSTGKMKKQKDVMWFERDIKFMEQWLLNRIVPEDQIQYL